MLKKIIQKLKTTIAGGAIIIAAFSILSKFVGLLRDRLIASQFGAGDVTDIYFASFRLPDLIFNTLVLGALSSAFIPVFISVWQKNKKEAWEVANSILNIILLILGGFAIIFFFLAPTLVPLIAPGFNLEKQKATIELTRVMLFSILFFGASNVISSILNSLKKFVVYSLAPIMYNLGIIFGVLVLVPSIGIWGLGYGVVIGSLLHLLIQLPSVISSGYRWQGILDIKNSRVKKIAYLMIPRTFGLAVGQVNQVVINVIASTLVAGSIAVYNFASNLSSFPVGIFAVSLAIASFPYFSESAAKKNTEEFVIRFSMTFRRILFLIIPASIFILLLRAQIVRLALGAGNFDWEDTVMTLETLGFFSMSLFAQALIPLIARAFYAHEDTKTPVIISFVSVLINVFFGLVLSKSMGVAGLALGFSISSIFNVILLFVLLHLKLHWLDEKNILSSIFKISFISIFAGATVQGCKYLVAPVVNMQTFVGVLIQFIVSAGVGVVVYIFLSFLCRCEEIKVLKRIKF